jgi:transposase
VFIKRTSRRVGGKTYVNHLLVESIATPEGPRHRTICSLGSLAPAPEAQWRGLAQKLSSALGGQTTFLPDPTVATVAARARPPRGRPRPAAAVGAAVVAVHTDQVETEDPREAGPVHVGHQLWRALELDRILEEAGLSARARRLTELMTLNRLVHPASEHAMPDWIRRTALADILGADFRTLSDEALYRNLDRLHPQRAPIERALAARERTLFNLDNTIYLYDLTSTYFEGQGRLNPQAKRGYSRDHRPDCKQVVVGLVLDRDGFPKAHEVFDGNRVDRTTLADMLTTLEQRTGRRGGATVVVDRGMAFADNLKEITDRGHHYLVAAKGHEAIGRLRERYPRVARYYNVTFDAAVPAVTWTPHADTKTKAEQLDGGYLLKTDRQDLSDEEIWRLYVLLTRVEDAFRDMKSPLLERPIFHHLEHRVQTHIFLCVLAYHLLVAIEKRFLDQGVHTSWATLREQLSTHQVVTVVLPATNGQTLRIRKGSTPDPIHRQIYRTLAIPQEVMKPVKTWAPTPSP